MLEPQGGKRKYGGITNLADMRANLRTHCIPVNLCSPVTSPATMRYRPLL